MIDNQLGEAQRIPSSAMLAFMKERAAASVSATSDNDRVSGLACFQALQGASVLSEHVL